MLRWKTVIEFASESIEFIELLDFWLGLSGFFVEMSAQVQRLCYSLLVPEAGSNLSLTRQSARSTIIQMYSILVKMVIRYVFI